MPRKKVEWTFELAGWDIDENNNRIINSSIVNLVAKNEEAAIKKASKIITRRFWLVTRVMEVING